MANPIEVVEGFAALIELMKNPDKFSSLVDEAKKVRDENQKLVEARVKLDKVDAYVKKAEADIDAKYNKLDEDIIAQNLKVDKFYTLSNEKNSEVAAREEKATFRELDCAKREEEVTKREKEAEKAFLNAQAMMSATSTKEEKLRAWETELQAKAAKIAAIVG